MTRWLFLGNYILKFIIMWWSKLVAIYHKVPDSSNNSSLNFLKVIFLLPLFSTVLPSNSRLFLSCRPFVVITIFNRSCGCWSYFCLLTWAVDRSNFNIHKTCWKCCYNNEGPTGQKQSTVRWKEGGK